MDSIQVIWKKFDSLSGKKREIDPDRLREKDVHAVQTNMLVKHICNRDYKTNLCSSI